MIAVVRRMASLRRFAVLHGALALTCAGTAPAAAMNFPRSELLEVGMSKSPGHQKWPEHKVLERPVGEQVTVEVEGEILADSHGVIRVEEDGSPARFYFPRGDVRMDKLARTATTTECPFKGKANYFSLTMGGGDGKLEDAVWSYEEPFDEHLALKDRLAFYDDKYRNIHVRVT